MNGLLCLQVVVGCFAYFFLYVYLTAKVAKRLQQKSYTGEAKHFYPAPVCMGLCGEQQHEARLADCKVSRLPLQLYMSAKQCDLWAGPHSSYYKLACSLQTTRSLIWWCAFRWADACLT